MSLAEAQCVAGGGHWAGCGLEVGVLRAAHKLGRSEPSKRHCPVQNVFSSHVMINMQFSGNISAIESDPCSVIHPHASCALNFVGPASSDAVWQNRSLSLRHSSVCALNQPGLSLHQV